MNIETITSQVRQNLTKIISLDRQQQAETIKLMYAEDSKLQSPYMFLNGRDKIIQSYATLAFNNVNLKVEIMSVTYDKERQTVLAEVQQVIRPKVFETYEAIGGILSVGMHFFLKLVVNQHQDGLYWVIDHTEIHVAQDLISQVPIIGGLYDGGLRNAMGQVSLAGTSLLQSSGILEPDAPTKSRTSSKIPNTGTEGNGLNINDITEEVKRQFMRILSMNKNEQKAAIMEIYDEGCNLESPYMALSGREEIIKSYATLASNNIDLNIEFGTVTYDPEIQIVVAEIHQLIRPKALCDYVSVKMHFFLKLEVEPVDKDTYLIVHHSEIHVGEDLISQMPILGRLYDGKVRSAVGQISIFGSSLLEKTGLLDIAPKAVNGVVGGATTVKKSVGSISSKFFGFGSSVLRATGVSQVVESTLGFAHWGVNALREKGGNEIISCYSISCMPGKICYSPTCPRNAYHSYLSAETLNNVIKGAYTGTSEYYYAKSG